MPEITEHHEIRVRGPTTTIILELMHAATPFPLAACP